MTSSQSTCVSYDEMASVVEFFAREVFAGREDAYPAARRAAHVIRALIDARIDMAKEPAL